MPRIGSAQFTTATQPARQADAYRMIRRRAIEAGIGTKIGNPSFRATGITKYLRNGRRREIAQQMANQSQRGQLAFMIGAMTRFRLMRWSGS
jgi:integrase